MTVESAAAIKQNVCGMRQTRDVLHLPQATDNRMGPVRSRRHRLQQPLFEMFDTNTWKMFEAALGVKPHELAGAFGIMGIPLVDAPANSSSP